MSSNPTPVPSRNAVPPAPKPVPSPGRNNELPPRFVIKLVGHIPN